MKLINILIPIIAIATLANAAVILQEGFETESPVYATFGEFTDGSDDYFTRTDGVTSPSGLPAYTNFSGSYFWAAEDTESASNPSGGLSQLEWSSLSISDYSQFVFSIDIGAGSSAAFDATQDYAELSYRVDDGGWVSIFRWEYDGGGTNSAMALDTDLDGIGEGSTLTSNLATYASAPASISGASLDLRFETYLTSANEAIAIDQVSITAVPEPSSMALLLGFATFLFQFRKNLINRKIDSMSLTKHPR